MKSDTIFCKIKGMKDHFGRTGGKGMYTLLIAEDERDLREAILRSVDWKSAGFEVVGAAETAPRRSKMVEQFEPDLVMTDIKMPILSGLELPRAYARYAPPHR